MTNGDGWVTCAQGHRHWGLFGASGLLITRNSAATSAVILQHRAPWTHQGDTWGVPGGARNSDETPLRAALREAGEEAGIRPADVVPVADHVLDHGGWSYTTVIAQAARPIEPHAANAESVTIRWVELSRVRHLVLHPGLASAWPSLIPAPERPRLLVPAGVLTDADHRRLQATGVAVASLPHTTVAPGITRLYPTVTEYVPGTAPCDGADSSVHPTTLDAAATRALLH